MSGHFRRTWVKKLAKTRRKNFIVKNVIIHALNQVILRNTK